MLVVSLKCCNEAIKLNLNIMSTTMNLAIETYANLTNQTAERIIELSLSGDKVVTENIMKLMFSAS